MPVNALLPSVVIAPLQLIEVIFSHCEKAVPPMLVTPLGRDDTVIR